MIETERLKLIACNRIHFGALLQSEQALADLLGADLAENWLIFPESIPFGLKMLEENSEVLRWGMYLILHKADNKLIGTGGFKGLADENGMVEIGYSLAPTYENQGYATEAAKGMIESAFSYAVVNMVDAHTLAEWNASTKVLQKCGMTKIAEKHDANDGDIWQWRILREEYESLSA